MTSFLTAEWRDLAMINWEIDPDVLQPLVPQGTVLDQWKGRTFISLIGFQFLRTRVLGLPVPFHTDFPEVNLRFYVRRNMEGDGSHSGVVFIKEMVPKAAVALMARAFYGENYESLPMQTDVPANPSAGGRYAYSWKRAEAWESLEAVTRGQPRWAELGSADQFLTEKAWGFTARKERSTIEYKVEHEKWQLRDCTSAVVRADIGTLYGEQFVPALSSQPFSAVVANGSPVIVHAPEGLPGT